MDEIGRRIAKRGGFDMSISVLRHTRSSRSQILTTSDAETEIPYRVHGASKCE
jgi:hypothetical protein